MQTLAAFIWAIVFAIAMLIGLDFKKWHGWLVTACVFLSGFFTGLSGPKGSVSGALLMGAFFTLITILGVKTTCWNGREGFKNRIRENFEQWFQAYFKKDE